MNPFFLRNKGFQRRERGDMGIRIFSVSHYHRVLLLCALR